MLACDMRFAARESAVFAQFESAFGQIPGGGAMQYLARLMGRARALEVLLSADDYDARARRTVRLDQPSIARRPRSARSFRRSPSGSRDIPAAGLLAIKERINAITLAPTDDFRRDSDLFGEKVRDAETQRRIHAAMRRGLQTRPAEMEFATILDGLAT